MHLQDHGLGHTDAKRTIASDSTGFRSFDAAARMTYRRRGPRGAGESVPLYALLDDGAQQDAQAPVQSRWHHTPPAPAEEASAKHRAAWRANVGGAGMSETPVVPAWRRNVVAQNEKLSRRS